MVTRSRAMQQTTMPLDGDSAPVTPAAPVPSVALVPVKPVQVLELPTDVVVTVVPESTVELIARMEREVIALGEITTPEQANTASAMLGQATELQREIEKMRKKIKEPYYRAGERIDEAAAAPKSQLEKVKDALKAKIQPYADKVEEERKAAEKRQQEELEKLRKQQQEAQEALDRANRAAEQARRDAEAAEQTRKNQEAAEQARKDQEAAARAAAPTPSAPTPVAAPPAPAPAPAPVPPIRAAAGQALRAQMQAASASSTLADLKAQERSLTRAPVPAPAKVVGIAHIQRLEFSIVDTKLVPEELLMPRVVDLAAVRRKYCVGWKEGDAIPQISGLQFKVEKTVRSS